MEERQEVGLGAGHEWVDDSLHDRNEALANGSEAFTPSVNLHPETDLVERLEKLSCERGESDRMKLRSIKLRVLGVECGWGSEGRSGNEGNEVAGEVGQED